MKSRLLKITPILLAVVLLLCACSVTRHVPESEEVVSRVSISVDGKPSSDNTLALAVSQKPYHRTFGFLPIATWIWHPDTTNWIQRTRGKLGTQPPIYSKFETLRSETSMRRAMINQGYLEAKVDADTVSRRRKVQVNYSVMKGTPHRISTLRILIEDPDQELARLLHADQQSDKPIVAVGGLLDRSELENERTRLTSLLRDNGYYDFNKEDISYTADTLRGSHKVDLTMFAARLHNRYKIRSVRYVPNYDLVTGQAVGDADYIRQEVLDETCFVQPGDYYSEKAVRDTYAALSRLHIFKYVNIRMTPDPNPDVHELECTIFMSPTTPHGIQLELDGTNTSGDLGVAASLTYTHRNLFRGSETYTASLKGGYESLTGDVSGFVNNNYSEYSFENQIDFPRFLCPFISPETRRSTNATTALTAGYSHQSRPEYTRIITQAGLTYKWRSNGNRMQHNFEAIDLSYVYLPKQSDAFQQVIGTLGPISYSSFTSHLILSSSYNIYLGNRTAESNAAASDLWSLRLNPELGGNVLSAVSRMGHFKKTDGRYEIFSLPFEQYARFDADFAYSHFLTDRNRLAFHLAGGVAVPYGNSKVMPFEKRYYSGGANSVRGWSVRTLGPGRYRNTKNTIDYFNQSGDIRFDASVEFRSRLIWKLEGAAFIDAGNVWTIKEYDSQPEGAFSSDFYKQIAASWGLGIRMVTDFVVLRLDMGFKGYDPSLSGSDAWVVTQPFKSSNSTLHFAVGYPF